MRYVFPRCESPFSRSLRKLRKKLRFNICAGTFKPAYFVTLTYNRKNFEELGRKVNASQDVSDFLKKIKRHAVTDLQYVWRLEVGSNRAYLDDRGKPRKATQRIHIHLLVNTNIAPFLSEWKKGNPDNENVLGDPDVVSAYLAKYMAKNKSEEESIDAIRYGKRRFGTSQGLLKPPKSRWVIEQNNDDLLNQSQVAIEKNIDWHLEQFKSKQKLLPITEKAFEQYLLTPYEKRFIGWMNPLYWFTSIEKMHKYLRKWRVEPLEKRYQRRIKRFIEKAQMAVGLRLEKAKNLIKTYADRKKWWQIFTLQEEKKIIPVTFRAGCIIKKLC